MGLALTKQALNHVEDLQGKRTAMDAVFAWHHFAHTHNELLSGDKLGGYDAKAMASANKQAAGKDKAWRTPPRTPISPRCCAHR